MDGTDGQISSDRFAIAVPSNLSCAEDVVGKAVDFIRAKHVDIDMYGFQIVLYEAISNAMRHGNKSDPAKLVSIGVEVCGKVLAITVEDQGDGFDWRVAFREDARDDDDPPLPFGRGGLLMMAYGYQRRYNEKGNRLVLSTVWPPPPPPA